MDHLVWPKNRKWPIPDIPCLTTDFTFDGKPWKEFPERLGWTERTTDEWCKVFERPAAELLDMLHRWRYFAYLGSILRYECGSSIDLSPFTDKKKGNKRVVDTTKIIAIINNIVAQSNAASSFPERDQDHVMYYRKNGIGGNSLYEIMVTENSSLHLEHRFAGDQDNRVILPSAAHQSSSENLSMFDYIHYHCPRDPLPACVVDSIWLAHDLVDNMLTLFPKPYDPQRWAHSQLNDMLSARRTYPLRSNGLASKKLRESGWCPARIHILNSRLSPAALLYCAHFSSLDQQDHRECNRSFCRFEKVAKNEYKTRHAEQCAQCQTISVDEDELKSILSRKQIPLISPSESSDGDNIALHAFDGNEDFVAISHVWSDGLGNLDGNGLPRCQLRELRECVKYLRKAGKENSNVSFWVDTICCPFRDDTEAQDIALSLMKTTYQMASAVLVLDSFLLRDARIDMADEEILLRIICSNWTSRLWTFQEGAVAQKVVFQLSDGVYDLREGFQRLRNSGDPAIRLTLEVPICRQICEICMFVNEPQVDGQKLLMASRSLKFRSTSVFTDEPICLANVMGYDSKEIVAASSKSKDFDKRMLKFWQLTTSIPTSLLFRHYDRLKFPGFRWAPRSFLFGTGGEPLENILDASLRGKMPVLRQDYAARTAQGLRLSISGWDLNHHWRSSLGGKFYFRARGTGRWFAVHMVNDLLNRRDRREQPFAITAMPPEGGSWRLMLVGTNHNNGQPSWLVHRLKRDNGIYYVRMIALAYVVALDEKKSWHPIATEDDAPYPKWSEAMWEKILFASYLDEDSEWCLD